MTPKSVQFKVQQRVLKTLAVLTTYLKFNDRDLYKIIGASYKYLHKYVDTCANIGTPRQKILPS